MLYDNHLIPKILCEENGKEVKVAKVDAMSGGRATSVLLGVKGYPTILRFHGIEYHSFEARYSRYHTL